MAKILVLYYSSYGHVETMAHHIAKGAQSIPKTEVDIKRIPETMSSEMAEKAGIKIHQNAPIAKIEDLEKYDAIIFGTPTRFGNMAGQMRQFLDQTGGLWMKGALIGKMASVFVSTGTGGGCETTITSFWNTLAHHGMIIVGAPYSIEELTITSELKGGSPYGAATIAGANGQRTPSAIEQTIAFKQGAHVAQLATKMYG